MFKRLFLQSKPTKSLRSCFKFDSFYYPFRYLSNQTSPEETEEKPKKYFGKVVLGCLVGTGAIIYYNKESMLDKLGDTIPILDVLREPRHDFSNKLPSKKEILTKDKTVAKITKSNVPNNKTNLTVTKITESNVANNKTNLTNKILIRQQNKLTKLRQEHLNINSNSNINNNNSSNNSNNNDYQNRLNKLRIANSESDELKKLKTEISILKKQLSSQEEYISNNMKLLKDGRRGYEEAIKIYQELKTDLQESVSSQMSYFENERQNRLSKLKRFKIEIGRINNIVSWYDENIEFYEKLSEIYNSSDLLERKINNGVCCKNELNYLLTNIPDEFLSKAMLNDLNNVSESNNYIISSHSELYDRFNVLEKSLRETCMIPSNTNTLFSKLLAKIFSKLLFHEQINRSGINSHSRISRAGYSVKSNDLESCVKELECLNENILFVGQDWLHNARMRLLALYTIKMIKSELLATSIHLTTKN